MYEANDKGEPETERTRNGRKPLRNTEKTDRVTLIGKWARECRRKERRNQGTDVSGTYREYKRWRELAGNSRELTGNSRGTHGELTGYSQRKSPETHRELTGNSRGTHRELTGYSQRKSPGTHRELTGNSSGTHWELTANSPGTHRELTSNSRATHRELIENSPGTHWELAGKSPGTHRKLTQNSQGTHWEPAGNSSGNREAAYPAVIHGGTHSETRRKQKRKTEETPGKHTRKCLK